VLHAGLFIKMEVNQSVTLVKLLKYGIVIFSVLFLSLDVATVAITALALAQHATLKRCNFKSRRLV